MWLETKKGLQAQLLAIPFTYIDGFLVKDSNKDSLKPESKNGKVI